MLKDSSVLISCQQYNEINEVKHIFVYFIYFLHAKFELGAFLVYSKQVNVVVPFFIGQKTI